MIMRVTIDLAKYRDGISEHRMTFNVPTEGDMIPAVRDVQSQALERGVRLADWEAREIVRDAQPRDE